MNSTLFIFIDKYEDTPFINKALIENRLVPLLEEDPLLQFFKNSLNTTKYTVFGTSEVKLIDESYLKNDISQYESISSYIDITELNMKEVIDKLNDYKNYYSDLFEINDSPCKNHFTLLSLHIIINYNRTSDKLEYYLYKVNTFDKEKLENFMIEKEVTEENIRKFLY